MQICMRWLAHRRVHVSVSAWAIVCALQAAAGGPWSTPRDVGLRSKCGVVVSSKDESGRGPSFTPAMLRSGVSAGLAWQTNWGSGNMEHGFTLQDYGPAKFVPQFWGAAPVSFEQVREPGVPIMLGFNEPDQGLFGGSSIDVRRALDLWEKNVAQAKAHGYKMFVAPSIAQALPYRYTGVGVGNEWLPQFLQACLFRLGCAETINFLGFHMYDPNCPTDESLVRTWSMHVRVNSVKKLAEEFNQKGMNIKGLWLTEFAGRSEKRGGGCQTLERQKDWMEKVVPMLNAEPAVVGYSWFSYGDGRSPNFQDNANLWHYDDGSLNLLGQTYFDLCRTNSEGGSWFIYIVAILGLLMCGIAVVYLMRHRIPADLSARVVSIRQQLGETMTAHVGGITALIPNAAPQQQNVDLSTLRIKQPGLAKNVEDCGELLKDHRRFVNECEEVFTSLKRNAVRLSEDLDTCPGKADVWRFIFTFAERRRIYRRQVQDLVAILEKHNSWVAVLKADADLRNRRMALKS